MENKIELKKHNRETYEIIKKAYLEKNHVCVVQATGTGKSFLIANTINDMKFKNVLFLTSSLHIINEFKENFEFMIDKIDFMTYRKLSFIKDFENFLKESDYDFIILDEYHRCGAKTWYMPIKLLLDYYKDIRVLGVTATPVRYLDNNKDMSKELFDSEPINEISLLEAINRNILAAPKYVLSYYKIEDEIEKLRLKSEKAINDDESLKNINYVINNMKSVSNVENVLSNNIKNERKFLVFCANVSHLKEMSKLVPKWFERIGFTTECYEVCTDTQDGKTTRELELEILKFKNSDKAKNKVTLLFSVNMLNEGIHIDDVDGLIFLRKTISPIIVFQQLGRALKTGNKSPLVFDFVNNINGFKFGERLTSDAKAPIAIEKIFNKDYTINSDIEVVDYIEQMELLLSEIEELSALTTWKSFICSLTEYKEKHGHCSVPSSHYLYKKCLNIRKEYRRGILNESKFKELDKLGFKWEVSIYDEERWEFMFEKLIQFKSIFGHTNVLRSYEDKQLATWVHTQRKFKDTMPNERKQKLLSIGFKFEIAKDRNQKDWLDMFNKLLEFKKEFKHVNVSSRYKDKKLANWVNSQRKVYKAGKLDEYRYNKLVSVGFMFAK